MLVAAATASVLAGCGGGGGGEKTTVVTQTVTTPAAATTTPTTPVTPAETPTVSAPSGGGGATTKAGTTLALGKSAVVSYVPPGSYGKSGPKWKLRLTVQSITKGAIDPDFNNIKLDAGDKSKTPYYVRLRVENLGPKDIKDTDMPTFAFKAIDDRGSEAGELTILGTFSKCENKLNPKPFKNGSTYETCQIYLVGGGGSIDEVQWTGSGGDDYSDKPITWKAG